jgi:hypothetical protein
MLPSVEQHDETSVPFEDCSSMPESDPVKWAISDSLLQRLEGKLLNQSIGDFSNSLRCYDQLDGEVKEPT